MSTTTSTVTGVDFVAIQTDNFDAAVDFYGNVLGLERGKQWGNMPGQEFQAGNLTLAVMESKAFGQEFRPGSASIALQVDDVEAMRKDLEAKGVTFHADTLDSGVCHMAFFSDPDGNPLMLHHRYAPKDARPGG